MKIDKLIRNQANTIELSIGVNATGIPTVAVTDGAGALIASGGTSSPSTGVYQFQLTPAQCAVLDQYKATWSAIINGQTNLFETYFEIVGGRYFSVPEARAFHTELSNETKYSDQTIVEHCGRSRTR